MIYVKVKENGAISAYESTVSDGVKFETIQFAFPEKWAGYTKTELFGNGENGENAVAVVLNGDSELCIGEDTCYIPHEVLQAPEFTVAVYGIAGDSVATTEQARIAVRQSGYGEGDEPADPTPTEYQQIVQIMEDTRAVAQSLREDADSGLFKGEKGDRGDRGERGEKGDKGDQGIPGDSTPEYRAIAEQVGINAAAAENAKRTAQAAQTSASYMAQQASASAGLAAEKAGAAAASASAAAQSAQSAASALSAKMDKFGEVVDTTESGATDLQVPSGFTIATKDYYDFIKEGSSGHLPAAITIRSEDGSGNDAVYSYWKFAGMEAVSVGGLGSIRLFADQAGAFGPCFYMRAGKDEDDPHDTEDAVYARVSTILESGNSRIKGKFYYNDEEVATVHTAAPAITETIYGTVVAAQDVSSVEHDLQITLESDTLTDYSDVTVLQYGKNLLKFPYATMGETVINGITWTVSEDGTITANGTATANSNFTVVNTAGSVPIKGETFTLSGCPSGGGNNKYGIYYYDQVTSRFDYGAGITAVAGGNVTVNIRIYTGKTVENLVFRPQIEIGAGATEFELYRTPITSPATADGKVTGLAPLPPNMTLMTDTEGVRIRCVYIADTKRYIGKKIRELISQI